MSEPENQSKKYTEHLNVPEQDKAKPPRQSSPDTMPLTSAWRLRFKIGERAEMVGLNDEIIIGRVLEDETGIDFDLSEYGAYHFGVSRRHAALSMHNGYLYVEDLGSTNGTRINGFQLTPRQKYRLRDGDEVQFARLTTVLYFEKR